MISRRIETCFTCYRTIPKGAEIGYKRGRGTRHSVCPPISTAELVAGRARYEASQAALSAQARMQAEPSFAKHDAANPLRQVGAVRGSVS